MTLSRAARVESLEVFVDLLSEADVPGGSPVSVSLAVEAGGRHRSAWTALAPGVSTVRIPLDDGWLPTAARRRITGLAWGFRAEAGRPPARVILRRLRAG